MSRLRIGPQVLQEEGMQAVQVGANGQVCRTEEFLIHMPQGELYAKCWKPGDGADAADAPIVLFHDSLGCVELWRDFPVALASATGRAVIAYDRLGFGRSSPHPGDWSTNFIRDEADHVFPLLRAALGIQDFIAFGYSVGGDMAACCAALNPESCKALITQSAPAFVDAGMLQGLRDAQQAFGQPGQLERLTKYHGNKASWALSAWLDTWLSEDFAQWRIEQVAPGLRCPLLVIHGDQDEYGSLAHPRHIVTLTSGPSELVIIQGCHHVPHREHPEIVLAAVLRFLEKLA
jgi:pimeloyl-ACP methyl ester carboxylesterase